MNAHNKTCCLCKKREADQTNSHIVPSFLVKSLFGNGNKKKAFLFNSDKLAQETQFSQDSDKEDYILCRECEMYFSVLETHVATRVNNRIKNRRFDSQFSDFEAIGLRWRVCNEVNPIIFKLFIYSIIYRCAITTIGVFQHFTLKESELKILKEYLTYFKANDQASVLSKIALSTIDSIDMKFAFITHDSFLDATNNSVGIHPGHSESDCYCFLLNEYYLFFSFKDLIVNQVTRFKKITNSKSDQEVKIGFMSTEQWAAMENGLLSIVMKTGINKIIEKGEFGQVMERLNKKR